MAPASRETQKIFCCQKIFLTAMKDMGIIVAILAFNDGKGDKV
jgi:hypothetical protein